MVPAHCDHRQRYGSRLPSVRAATKWHVATDTLFLRIDHTANVISETEFLGISVDEATQTLRNSRSAFVSTGAVELPDGKAGFRKAVTVRDPDGHAIQIVER